VTVLFALLAALANAVVVVTQHVASSGAPGGTSGLKLARYLVRSPLWLLGWIGLAGSFAFQALALHVGQLSVVQPLLVVELVFTLVLRRACLRQAIAPGAWGSAALTCAGLALFLEAADVRGGSAAPTAGAWVTAVLACAGVAAVLAATGRAGPPGRRAVLWGASAAVLWALVATFIKATTDTLSQYGVGGTLERWPVYALAAGGALGFLVEQTALRVGPLRSSQPMLVIVDPMVSIGLGVWLYDEHFAESPLALTVAGLAFAVMCVGVAFLTRTSPVTMEPTSAR
jgi:hypothetical protein